MMDAPPIGDPVKVASAYLLCMNAINEPPQNEGHYEKWVGTFRPQTGCLVRSMDLHFPRIFKLKHSTAVQGQKSVVASSIGPAFL